MTRLVDVPAQFDDRSFEQFAGAYAAAAQDGERLLFDAHASEWASPYGLVGLLAAGQAARGPGGGDGGRGAGGGGGWGGRAWGFGTRSRRRAARASARA